ncbi:MAG: ParB/RepB/Spo0J family partition protein [Clostridia bacterium]|nr:ParB/RepB/Spo0J family partition protein [Clostridia bacterium]
MAKDLSKMPLPKLDDLFTTEEERTNAQLEKVIDIKISDIDDFPNHPFKVIENDDMYNMRDSIKENGVLVPALVRQKPDGRYEMVSGHRRKYASQLANKETIPCIVRDLTDDEAIIIMVDSNLQREEILPSEKAHAYKMKYEAIKHQGKRTDLTSSPVATKLDSASIIGKESGESRDQVYRYMSLNNLIPDLLDMVDNDVLKQKPSIALRPAVELSHLTEEEQYQLLDCIEYCDATPSHDQAIRLRALSKSKTLTQNEIDRIMSEEKPNQIPHISFNETRIRSVLPKEIKGKNIEDFVIKAIEFYGKHLQKQKSMER